MTTIDTVANLAKLDIPEESATKISADLDEMIGFVNELKSVDTSNVTPMVQPIEYDHAIFRDDVVECEPTGSEESFYRVSQTV